MYKTYVIILQTGPILKVRNQNECSVSELKRTKVGWNTSTKIN